MAPTPDPLCCASTPYYSTAWQECNSAADASLSEVKSCTECYAYHCIDWTVGSAAMQARETTFYNKTGEKVTLNINFLRNFINPSVKFFLFFKFFISMLNYLSTSRCT